MLKVHYRGIAGCGGFTGALTSAKVEEAADLARVNRSRINVRQAAASV